MTQVIHADPFIDDRTDAAAGLRRAIAAAAQQGANELVLGAGHYRLCSSVRLRTPSIAHDDGCGDVSEKDVHLLLRGLSSFTIRGQTHPDGTPATLLEGVHDGAVQTLLPSLIWAENCIDLRLENLAFTRSPEMATAGLIKAVAGACVTVQVFAGLPIADQMAAYCMNRFDPVKQVLLGESLTYGFGYDHRWQSAGSNRLILRDSAIASRVSVGEGLSWHQSGKTDFALFFGGCERLQFSNLRIVNTNGFGILTEQCRDISAEHLVLRPNSPQFFTGPRDGWKIYRCGGKISLEHCHIEGVRMDGQNVHSNYLVVESIESDRTMICRCKYAPIPLRTPAILEYAREMQVGQLCLTGWEVIGGVTQISADSTDASAGKAVAGVQNHITRYRLEVGSPIPAEIVAGTLLHADCWAPQSYRCRHSVFRNIAGAGQLLRCKQVEISHCTYEHLMNAGILIGAELDTHCESDHGSDILIDHCTFTDCGNKPRYGRYGMGGIAVKSQGFAAPLNHHITITDNHFSRCSQAVELADAREVTLLRNTYESCAEQLVVEGKTTHSIYSDG